MFSQNLWITRIGRLLNFDYVSHVKACKNVTEEENVKALDVYIFLFANDADEQLLPALMM